jgi:AcrR family transcriptional regulator
MSRVQQARLLDAAVELVVEGGGKRLSASRVAARAGMSSKTFYDLFADGEECFLAVFDRAVDELAVAVGLVWAGEGEWVQRVRGALIVLLGVLEREPAVGRVVFVEALGAGPRVLARRAEVLEGVVGFLDEGRVGGPAGLPSLVAAGVVGAAFGIVHARLVERCPGSLMELVNAVVATVVLPYQGREAAARELERPVPVLPEPPVEFAEAVERARPAGGVGARPRIRPTRRTYMVLAAVAELGGANNRRVGAGAQLRDEAQISRLLSRLEGLGLVENRAGGASGFVKAWWLTPSGEEFLREGARDTSIAAAVRPVRRGRPVRAARVRGSSASAAKAGRQAGR